MEFPTVLVSSAYLPPIDFWIQVAHAKEIRIDQYENYIKQEIQSRCQILTSQGSLTLTIPVLNGRSITKQSIKDTRIAYPMHWQKEHWRSIQTAYRKAPYFLYYQDYFEAVYQKKPAFLYDWNHELMTLCRKLLNDSRQWIPTEGYHQFPEKGVFDARITSKSSNNQPLSYEFSFVSYRQNFGEQFFPNLSILDLLMCQGPQAKNIILEGLRTKTTNIALPETAS